MGACVYQKLESTKIEESKMSRWKKAEVEEEKPSRPFGTCMAYGCPMAGSLAKSTSGEEHNWMCQLHFEAEPYQWQEVTHILKSNMVLVTLIREIRLAKSGKLFDVSGRIAALKLNGFDDLVPNNLDRRSDGKLSISKWQSRVETVLYKKVKRLASRTQVTEQKPTSKDLLMDQIDDFLKLHKVI